MSPEPTQTTASHIQATIDRLDQCVRDEAVIAAATALFEVLAENRPVHSSPRRGNVSGRKC